MGKEIKIFKAHTEGVLSVSFSPDGKTFISGSRDNTVKLWNVETGKEIATFISIDSTDWITLTPDGYFYASKGATKLLSYTIGSKVYNFDQFDLQYNRPDIILQRLGYADTTTIQIYYAAYKKRLQKTGFTEDMFSPEFHTPEIKIVEKQYFTNTSDSLIQFEIKAWDSKYKLDRINLWINNVPIWGMNGENLRGKETSKVSKEIKVLLCEGKNKIEISVHNQKAVESLKETFYVTYTPQIFTKPDLYLIAIGVSEFQQSDYNLTYAAKDALDISKLYETENNNFKNKYIYTLVNEQATNENIIALKQNLLNSKPDDHVIIFVASHGLLDDSLDYYLATHNINFDNPSEGGLLYDELENLLDSIPARKVKPFGSPDNQKVGLKNSFELMKELFADLRRGSGAVVISSAGGGEFAYEGEDWKNGVFTYSFIEGITTGNADLNKDKTITVSELRDYVFDKVSKLTNGKQNPTARRENLEFDFEVW